MSRFVPIADLVAEVGLLVLPGYGDRGRILREPLRLGKALERHLGSLTLGVALLKQSQEFCRS